MADGILDVIEFTEGAVPITSIEVSPKSIDRKPDAMRIKLSKPEETKTYGNLDETSL